MAKQEASSIGLISQVSRDNIGIALNLPWGAFCYVLSVVEDNDFIRDLHCHVHVMFHQQNRYAAIPYSQDQIPQGHAFGGVQT